jgi:hypothetical protein
VGGGSADASAHNVDFNVCPEMFEGEDAIVGLQIRSDQIRSDQIDFPLAGKRAGKNKNKSKERPGHADRAIFLVHGRTQGKQKYHQNGSWDVRRNEVRTIFP